MKLTVCIDLPEREEIVGSGCPVPIARKSEKWNTSCLGNMKKEKGVYVIHHNEKIIYVGKTDGPSMNFGMRLRREFQENASQGKHIYPRLSSLSTPPAIKATFYNIPEIIKRMNFEGHFHRPDQMIGIFEMLMISYLEPELQQHFFDAVTKTTEEAAMKFLGVKPLSQDGRAELRARIARAIKENQHTLIPPK